MKRKHRHLSARLVTRLDDVAASPEVLGRVLAHAGEACDDCAAVLADYGAVGSLGRARFGYRRAGQRAARRAFAASRECQLAEGLLTELFALASWERLVAALGSNPRFQTWGVASRLIDSAVAALETNAEEAAAMATLALVVAEALDERYPRTVVADTRAMASVQLAKARLALGDLAAAHQALASAETLRRRGSGARFFRAEVALAQARHDLASRRPEAAAENVAWVAGWAAERRWVEYSAEAALLEAAIDRALGGLPEAAVRLTGLVEALRQEPEASGIERRARLELGATLADLGNFQAAWEEVAKLRLLFPDPPAAVAARREWVAGRALAGLGRARDAEEALTAAWRGLAAAGYPLEAASAVGHFAVVLAVPGGYGRRMDLIEEASDLLGSGTYPPEGMAAFLEFQAAVYGACGHGEAEAARSRLAAALPASIPVLAG